MLRLTIMILRFRKPACFLTILASLASFSFGETPQEEDDEPIEKNGLEIRGISKGILEVGGTVKATIVLENKNKIPIQTLIPPGSMCNVCWNCTFEPAIHEQMDAFHTTFPGVSHDKVATIQPGKSIEFTIVLKRNDNGIFIKSDCGEFGCLSAPLKIEKGTKEIKLIYQHKDSGAEWTSGAGGDVIKFSEKRWTGNIKSAPIVIKLL